MSIVMNDNVQKIMQDMLQHRPELDCAQKGLEQAWSALIQNFTDNGILYLAGNGGSFADAIHIKGELAKKFERLRPLTEAGLIKSLEQSAWGPRLLSTLEAGLPVIVLGESHSLRSAFENDGDPVLSYAQELNAFAAHIQPGAFLGISTSGNAENVNAALALAKAYGLKTISFTGPQGGKLAQEADIAWRAPGSTTALIQENQIILYHALCAMIEAHFYS